LKSCSFILAGDNMKPALLIMLLIALPCAQASVVISKVLYDPTGTESGGEAIELWNTGSSAVLIEDWIIATASSSTDAVLPRATLLPGQRYLVADEGWDEKKDNLDWVSADYEERITLGNKDSGVAIIDNGTIVDAVGWGDAEEHFTAAPASPVSSGACLVRTGFADDNSLDFIEQSCDFFDGISIIVEAELGTGFSAWIETDDSNDTGIQVKPSSPIIVKANGPANVTLAGKAYALQGTNGSYSISLDSSGLVSGTYALTVNDLTYDVTILPEAYIRAKQTSLELDPADVLVIENLGSVAATVTLVCEDLEYQQNKIHRDHVKVDGKGMTESYQLTLAPGDKKELTVSLDNKINAPPGHYSATLRITYGS
jgi:hypothetical protein